MRAVLLLYTAFETPTLMALGDPPYDSLHELLRQAAGCCRRESMPIRPQRPRGAGWRPRRLARPAPENGPRDSDARRPAAAAVHRLTAADVPVAVGAAGYPASWFDPRQIDTNTWPARQDELVALRHGATGQPAWRPSNIVASGASRAGIRRGPFWPSPAPNCNARSITSG